jgi:hypothetical protein
MGKQHETIPNEPQEAPIQPDRPEIQQPVDPQSPHIPEEAPPNEPQELPKQAPPQPEIPSGKEPDFNKTEV